jgi:glycine/D-amino acid oxidase-like deaminating enzyme
MLSDRQLRTVLPEGHVASDTRKLLLYYRCYRGRLIMGGRGTFREPAGPRDYRHLEMVIGLLFPQLKGTRCEFFWTGRVALTRDHVPHVHQPAPGLTVFLGYNGRGVAMATTLGTLIAKNLIAPADNPLPLPITGIRPIPLHSMHRAYATAVMQMYRLKDYVRR